MIKKFIKSLREESDGFVIDKPWRLEESSVGVVIPIIRKLNKKRSYITFGEAQDIKIEDTGQIDYVYIKNNEDKPVLISRGEIFRGKTQERSAIHDHIIKAKSGLRVAVRCIHQSQGISAGSDMKYGGRVPYSIDLSSQGQTWSTVNVYSTNVYNSNSSDKLTNSENYSISNQITGSETINFGDVGSDDLVSTMNDLTNAMRDVLKKVPYIKDQVGAFFYKENVLMGLDVYNYPASWKKIKQDIIEKEGSLFVEKDENNMFEFKKDNAKKMAKKHLGVEFSEKVIYDKEYKLVEIRSDKLIGEAIIFKNDVIHLTMWKCK